MALYSRSELPAFFSRRQVNLKNSLRILPYPTVPEDDLPGIAKSQKMTYEDWPNRSLRKAGISKEDLMKPAA
jgi:hypothetical protein